MDGSQTVTFTVRCTVCVCVCVCVEDKSIVVYKHNHFGTFWEFTGVSTGVRVCTDYQ